MNIKYLFAGLCCLTFFAAGAVHAADEKFLACGPGYILASKGKIDGVNAAECQKLWCRDLENGKYMGSDNSAAAGYKTTGAPVELCDSNNKCIECFGDRKWCVGEATGVWNPEFGAYTRGGGDVASYKSYLKGSCFAWRLEKPNCPNGETAVLKDGDWLCVTQSSGSSSARESAIRRTGTVRRAIK